MTPALSDIELEERAVARVVDLMATIALESPVYQRVLTDRYLDLCFRPAVIHSRVDFMCLPNGATAFFTHVRPRQPLQFQCAPDPEDWTARGPVMWIVDACCTRDTDAREFGRAMVRRARERGLASAGEKVLFWRTTGKLGWSTMR